MSATVISPATVAGIGAGGTVVTTVATDNTNGNSFVQDGRTLLRLVNTDASSRTVTFPYPILVDGATVPSKVITLTAGQIVYVQCGNGPNDKGLYVNGAITFQSNNALVKYELVTLG